MAVNYGINVVVNPAPAVRGIRVVRKEMQRVSTSADRVRNSIRRAFAIAGVTVGVRQIVDLVDAFNRLENRLRVVTKTEGELALVEERLLKISNQTRSSFLATTELYARLAINSRELGASQEELLQFTKSVNEAIIISGASAKEANAGLIQLSQGLASGALRGDELRSVLEQLPVIADVIAEELGVNRGVLRDLGTEGKITSKVIISAFQNARVELEERFLKTIPTIGQSFQILSNEVIKFLGDAGKTSGATEQISKAVIGLANNLETFGRVAIGAATALTVVFVGKGITAAIAGLNALKVALLTNPMTALPGLVAIAAGALVAFGDQIFLTSEEFTNLQDFALGAFDSIQAGAIALVQALEPEFIFLGTLMGGSFEDAELSAKSFFDFLALTADQTLGLLVSLGNTITTFFVGIWDAASEQVADFIIGFIDLMEEAGDGVHAMLATVIELAKIVLTGLVDSFTKAGAAIQAALSGNIGDAARLALEAKSAFEVAIGGAFEQIPDIYNKALQEAQNNRGLVELENKFRGATERLGESLQAAIFSGLDVTLVRDFLEAAETEADARATVRRARAAREAREREEARAGLGEKGAPVAAPEVEGGLEKVLRELAEEASLLRLVNSERQIQAELFRIENQLRGQNVELSESDRKLLQTRLESNRALSDQAFIFDNLNAAQEDLIRGQAAINGLMEQGTISADQYAMVLRQLEIAALESSTSLSGGFARGFLVIREGLEDISILSETLVTSTFNSLEDQIVQFTTTGKASFEEFANAVLADLARISANKLLQESFEGVLSIFGSGSGEKNAGQQAAKAAQQQQLLIQRKLLATQEQAAATTLAGASATLSTAVVGLATGGTTLVTGASALSLAAIELAAAAELLLIANTASVGGLAHGGPITPGSPRIVGEEGPELFNPSGAGHIIPADETAKILSGRGGQPTVNVAPAQVNVQVVNVQSESDVTDAMDSREGDQLIINSLARNPAAVRSALGV